MLRIAIISDTSPQACFAVSFETVIVLIQILNDFSYLVIHSFSITIVHFLGVKYKLETEKYFLILLASVYK